MLIKTDPDVIMVFSQIKGLEGEMKPLKDGVQSLTSQKDALLAEKTALKNEASLAHHNQQKGERCQALQPWRACNCQLIA